MVKLFIPCHENRKSPTGQLYTVYRIEVYHNGCWNRIEKRYNDFYQLHKEMKKICSTTPKFPPKKMMRNLSNTVIEERRSHLEKYLQELLRNEIAQPGIFEFLSLSQVETNPTPDRNLLRPLSMIAFSNDLLNSPSDDECLEGCSPSSLPDIVLKGALEAFYSHEDFRYKISKH